MSITITPLCESHEFVYNPFYYQFTSTNSSKLNFQFVVDLYGDHSPASTYLGRFKIPLREDGTGIFSPARILESIVSPVFEPTTTAMTESFNSYVRYKIELGEQYDNSTILSAATGVTVYSALTATSINYAVNAVRQYDQLHNLYTRQYDPGVIDFPYFMTDWQRLNYTKPKKISRNEFETIGYYSELKSNEFVVQTFDSASTQIGEFTISNGWNSNSIHHVLGVGTANLNYSHYNTITSSPTNIMDAAVKYYLVYTSFSGQRSTEFDFMIDDACTYYDPIRLAWLNKWGSFDYFTFDKIHRNTFERKNNEWQQRLNPNYTVGDLSRQNLNVELKKKLTINSGFIDDIDSAYITGLFESPLIYQVLEDGSYLPLQLIDTSYEEKQIINERLIQHTFNFEYAFNRTTQRT